MKTKTQFLLYNKDHEIKTNYHRKYEEKDLYSATLIPEYGSWIRFGFQKNIKINPYKYPIKNQEEASPHFHTQINLPALTPNMSTKTTAKVLQAPKVKLSPSNH